MKISREILEIEGEAGLKPGNLMLDQNIKKCEKQQQNLKKIKRHLI